MATTTESVSDLCLRARDAARVLAATDTATKDRALHAIAYALEVRTDEILEANAHGAAGSGRRGRRRLAPAQRAGRA
jgi:gamma-glutamyl phosphate reductase